MWYPLLDAYLFSYKRDVRFIALENAFEKESFPEFFDPPLVNKARARCPSKNEKHFWCFCCSLFIYLFCLCFRFRLYISFSQERTNSRISCFNRHKLYWLVDLWCNLYPGHCLVDFANKRNTFDLFFSVLRRVCPRSSQFLTLAVFRPTVYRNLSF